MITNEGLAAGHSKKDRVRDRSVCASARTALPMQMPLK
jgi:hypothetical protein